MNNNDLSDIKNVCNRVARWLLLRALHVSQNWTPQAVLLNILSDYRCDVDGEFLLIDLEKRGYCINEEDAWRITPEGIDIVEGNADCPKAIGRPPSVVIEPKAAKSKPVEVTDDDVEGILYRGELYVRANR